jgi:biotin carboxylase
LVALPDPSRASEIPSQLRQEDLIAMSPDDYVVFLECDSIGTGRLFFECAHDLGIRPVLFSVKPYRSLTEFDRVALPEMSERCVIDAIHSLGRHRIRGLWALRDFLAPLAARVSATVALPGADVQGVELCCDKLRTRQRLLEAGLNDVKFGLAHSGEEAAGLLATLGDRVVMKPRSQSGSVGVKLCCSPEEARRQFQELAETLPGVCKWGVIIETAIEGPQFSVQAFDGKSIGVTRQDIGPPPAFVTVGLDFPWVDDLGTHSEVALHAERALAAVGHIRGPASVDMRYGPLGPCVIEINPRLAGDMIPENVRLALGIDVVKCTILFACGMPYEIKPQFDRASATRWLLRPGQPVTVRGEEDAAAVAGVARVRTFRKRYGREGPAKDFRDRIAFVISEAETVAVAGEIAASALRQLRVSSPVAQKRRSWRSLVRKSITRILGRLNVRTSRNTQAVPFNKELH